MPSPPYYIRTFAVDAQGKPDRTAKNRDYMLKVHQHLCRTPVDACGLEPGTYFVPLNADATGELDDDVSADDNLCISMRFDHEGYAPPCGLPTAVDLTFDVPIGLALHGYEKLQGYYVGQVWPNFFEADENERLFVWSPDAPFIGLGPLDEWQEGQESAFHLADDEPGEGDYTYLVTYRRCHFATHEFCTNVVDDP